MAVTTTPQDILNAAYAKSTKNQPGSISTESTELLQVVIRALRGLYSFAARVNPMCFAAMSTAVWDTDGWPWPEGAESLFKIENNANGSLIVVVPFDDTGAEAGKPAVFNLGNKFYPAGNANDPDNAVTLAYRYSKRPDSPADLNTALDGTWLEQFNELLSLEVAMYLALKDGRMTEFGALKVDRELEANQFAAHLEHRIANERRRWGHVRRFVTNTLVPTSSLLIGGTGVQIAEGAAAA
jgi:hypothetical protein